MSSEGDAHFVSVFQKRSGALPVGGVPLCGFIRGHSSSSYRPIITGMVRMDSRVLSTYSALECSASAP